MNNEAAQKLQTAGGAEREAREVAEEINRRNQRRNHVLRDGFGNIAPIMPTEEMAGIIAAALARCANEARLEEQTNYPAPHRHSASLPEM